MPLYERNGGKGSRLYQVWASMKSRCLNKNHQAYATYGGRGIIVCTDWINSFSVFREWAMSFGYKTGLVLDREDNDLGYNPDNCRWVTASKSQNNKSNTHYVFAFGERKPITEWERDPRCKVSKLVIARRIKAGWPANRAIIQASSRSF